MRMRVFYGACRQSARQRWTSAVAFAKSMKEKERATPQLPSDSFVRSGSVQGWRGKLTPAQIEVIEKYAGSCLVKLGYSLSTAPLEPAPVS